MGSFTATFTAYTSGLTGLTAYAYGGGSTLTGGTVTESPAASGVYLSTFTGTAANTVYACKLKDAGGATHSTGSVRTDANGDDAEARIGNLPSAASGTTGGLLILGTGTGGIAPTGGSVALTTAAQTSVAAVVWNRLTSVITTTGSVGKWLLDKLDTAVSTRQAAAGVDALSNAVDLLPLSYGSIGVGGSAIEALSSLAVRLSVAAIVAEDSGVVEPLTYQWHRSTTSGFTPDGSTAIAGAVAATLTNTPPGIGPYYYKPVVADQNGYTVVGTQRPVWLIDWPLTQSAATTVPAGTRLHYVYFSDSRGESSVYNSYTSPIDAMVLWLNTNTTLIASATNYSVAGRTAATCLSDDYAGALTAEGGTFAGKRIRLAFGVNEAQGAESASAFVTALMALAAKCLADGADAVEIDYPTWREPGYAAPTSPATLFPEEPYSTLIQQYQTALDAAIGQPLSHNGVPQDASRVHVGDRKTYKATAMFPSLYLWDRLHLNKAGATLMGANMGEAALQAVQREFGVTTQRATLAGKTAALAAQGTGSLTLAAVNTYGTATSAALTTVASGVLSIGEAVEELTGQQGGGDPDTIAAAVAISLRSVPPNLPPYTQGRNREIMQGDTYGVGQRAFIVNAMGGELPADLSTRTWSATFDKIAANTQTGTATLTVPATVTQATGASRALSVSLTGTQTAALAIGLYDYAVTGVDEDDNAYTVETGRVTVKARPGTD